MRIVFGGFIHETNTFAPTKADWDAFVRGGSGPAMVSGEAVRPTLAGSNIPAAGFVQAAEDAGHTLIATTWCGAAPSAHVTEEAFERIAGMILCGITEALPVDAVYLDLHGAMVTEHLDDGEGELLRRVRELVGNEVPMVASLDLHANVTHAMLNHADALVAYRTYPHVDMAETGRRTFEMLAQRWAAGKRPRLAFRRLPFLIPLCWQCTSIEPCKGIYALLRQIESESGAQVSFTPGFPAADFPECSPVVWAYADDQETAEAMAARMAAATNAAELAFAGKLYTPDEAVQYAMCVAEHASKPVVIADAQDNPGAGGNSDTTGVLRALIRNRAKRAAIGLIVDRSAVAAVHAAGEGNRIRLAIGGRSGVPGDDPFEGDFLIERVSNGKFDATGPYYHGFKLDVGAAACLRIDDVRIVLASFKVQLADQAMFRFVGIEPTEHAILVVKSSVHFRADFAPIAEQIILCAAPGPMPMEPKHLPWRNLPAGLRLAPGEWLS